MSKTVDTVFERMSKWRQEAHPELKPLKVRKHNPGAGGIWYSLLYSDDGRIGTLSDGYRHGEFVELLRAMTSTYIEIIDLKKSWGHYCEK